MECASIRWRIILREELEADRREKWNNPSIIVQSENAFSVVARPEYSTSRPFSRYTKHKDDTGVFIVIRRNKRIYEDMWVRN